MNFVPDSGEIREAWCSYSFRQFMLSQEVNCWQRCAKRPAIRGPTESEAIFGHD